jgi:hypothetical protein
LVYSPLQPLPALCLPHEPQLQTVHTAATLHHLVSCVQSHIIELVLLEEVAGLEPMAALEQVLCGEGAVRAGFSLGLRWDRSSLAQSTLSVPWHQAAL